MRGHLKLTLIYALSILVAKGASFAMLPLVTRYIEVAEYGVLEVLVSIADVGTIVLGMGLAETLFRFAGKEKNYHTQQHICASIFGLALVVTLVAIPLLQLLAPMVASSFALDMEEVDVRLIMYTLVLTSCIQIPLGWLRMQDHVWLFFKLMAGKTLFQSALVAIFLLQDMGVTSIMLGGAIADTVFVAWLAWLQHKATGISFDFALNRKFIHYGAPLIVVGMTGFVMGSFDRWILADHVSGEHLAEYGLAAKFGLITFLLMEPFNMWWFPRRFGVLHSENGKQKSAVIVDSAIALIILMAVGVSVAGPVFIYLLTPAEYHGAMELVPWLALIALLNCTAGMINIGIYAQKSSSSAAAINILSASVAVLGYMYYIPFYGVEGTIGVTVAAFSLRLVLYYAVGQRKIHLPHQMGKLLLFGGVSTAGVWWISQFIASPFTYAAYGIGLWIALVLISVALLFPAVKPWVMRGVHV